MSDEVVENHDGKSFLATLTCVVEDKWSGMLNAFKDSCQVGVVVLRDGHVAWAVSNSQKENFASFLERIGMVPKDKLDEVVRKYRSLGKSKKLGALLEETGLISHKSLRDCLRAHIHAALSSLTDDPEIVAQARAGEMIVDASLLFSLREVLPDPHDGAGVEIATRPLNDPEDSLLCNLASLQGYLYSLVADTEGNQIACHVADGVPVNAGQVLPSLLGWLSASSLGSDELGMGKLQFEFIQSERGALFVHMADGGSPCFLAVACNDTAKLGVVRHKMSELMPEVQRLAEMR